MQDYHAINPSLINTIPTFLDSKLRGIPLVLSGNSTNSPDIISPRPFFHLTHVQLKKKSLEGEKVLVDFAFKKNHSFI